MPDPVLAGLLVGALMALGTVAVLREVTARGRASDRSVALLSVLGMAWQQANKPIEGVILWTVTPAHGLVLADLLAAPAAAIVAGHLLSRIARRLPAGRRHRRAVLGLSAA